MSATFFTNLTEEEFKNLLKLSLKEILQEELGQLRSTIPETLNIKEAADLLKLKITTLYEKTSKKQIPHFKKGNKLYFNRTELEKWISGGKVKTHFEIESDAATFILNGKKRRDH